MHNKFNNKKDYALLTGNTKSWIGFTFHLKESQLVFLKEKFSFSYLITYIFIILLGELVFQKTLLSQSFIVIVISLPLMVFALIYNKKIAKFTVTFNFDNKLIVLNKYNKSIAFSEVVEILFINGKIKSTEIAEIQLITHQENFLLASYLMNISYYETIPQEILKKLESSFKLNRCRLAN